MVTIITTASCANICPTIHEHHGAKMTNVVVVEARRALPLQQHLRVPPEIDPCLIDLS